MRNGDNDPGHTRTRQRGGGLARVMAACMVLVAGCAAPDQPGRARSGDPACRPAQMQGNGGGLVRCPPQPSDCVCQEM